MSDSTVARHTLLQLLQLTRTLQEEYSVQNTSCSDIILTNTSRLKIWIRFEHDEAISTCRDLMNETALVYDSTLPLHSFLFKRLLRKLTGIVLLIRCVDIVGFAHARNVF